MIQIERASQSNMNAAELKRTYDMMIYAYAVTEKEIWGENYVRLDLDEFKSLIQSGSVYLAKLDGEIVGSVCVTKEGDDTFNFGLLNADFSKKGMGIGRKLIATAEKHAIDAGGKYMNIEILKASNIEVPSKINLDKWYRKLGYEFTKSMSFVERKPNKAEKAKRLINPTQFDCYRKVLIPS